MIAAKNKEWPLCTINQEIRGKVPQKNTVKSNALIYILKCILHNQVGLIPRMQGWFHMQNSINWVSKKNQMITSIDGRKSIQQNPTLKHNKNLTKLRTEGNFLDLTGKVYGKKKTCNIVLVKKTECFPPNIRNQSRMSSLTTRTQHQTGSPSKCIKKRKCKEYK